MNPGSSCVLTQNANVLRFLNRPDAVEALVSGPVEVDRIATGDGCHLRQKGPKSRALPASRDVRLTV